MFVCGGLHEIGLHRLIGVAFIGGVALLEWVSPCCRKCVTGDGSHILISHQGVWKGAVKETTS